MENQEVKTFGFYKIEKKEESQSVKSYLDYLIRAWRSNGENGKVIDFMRYKQTGYVYELEINEKPKRSRRVK